MSLKSIKVTNLLSFDNLSIANFKDINCIVGENNTGKSNLLKLLRYFYNKLENKRELPPTLNSKYSSFGSITIIYDMSRIKKIVEAEGNKNKSVFFKHIFNTFFKDKGRESSLFELTLQVNSNDSIKWSVENKEILTILNYLYPFFDIETRHINLYDWDKLWLIVSRLKSFNINKIKSNDIIDFFDEKISDDSNSYKDYIKQVQDITKTSKYNYREKVLNYVKAGLKGHTFLIGNESLDIQSDGTNSHKFIEIALELLISLSRRDYISPIIYIDEPEIGLHPKRNEVLIYNLFKTYNSFKKTKETKEKGKYKTPYPTIIFATHSANIVKEVIKLFDTSQQVLHFSKNDNKHTTVQLMNSNYKDKRFLNIFSDNESRLFFSTFILFVEGETELEIFRNKNLVENFNVLTNIDVYKSSSNVFGAHINPSYANTAIPYLFLFDADKIYSFSEEKQDKTRKKIKLLNSNKALYFLPDGKKENEEEFNTLLNKYKKGFNKRYASKLNNLLDIKNIQNITFTINEQSFKVKENIQYLEQVKHLKTYLSSYNVSFVHTTIEEVLINKKSEALFYKWLKFKFSIDVEEFLYDKREVAYSYSCYKKRLGIGRLIYLNPRKVIQKKIIYLNPKYESYIIEEFVNYIRVRYFEGKFEILNNKITEHKKTTNKKDKNNFTTMKTSLYAKLKQMNSSLNAKQKENLEKIFHTYLDVSSSAVSKNKEIEKIIDFFPLNIQGKTSGWATSFLSFAINELKDNNPKIPFNKKFKKSFRELYDIITIIEKKT